QAGYLLFGYRSFGSNDRLLPFREMDRRISRRGHEAALRKRSRIAHEFPKTPGFRSGGAEKIGPEIPGVFLGAGQSVKEIAKGGGFVARAGHGVKGQTVGNQLLLLRA